MVTIVSYFSNYSTKLILMFSYIFFSLTVHLPKISEIILSHDVLTEELNNPTYGHGAKRHLLQTASLLGHLENSKLIQNNTCFIEFGAGKGR